MSASTRRPRRRSTRAITLGAVATGLVASGALVWGASYSAFSATTSNGSNNWSAGTVALTDDGNNTAMFNATNLKPGSTDSKCIAVTSSGSVASAVKLYGTGATTTKALSSSLNLTVVQGTGGNYGSCTGFTPLSSGSAVYTGTLASFGTAATNYSTGLGTWAPTGTASETRVYKITYGLDTSTPNSVQGGTASIGFTWEAQNS